MLKIFCFLLSQQLLAYGLSPHQIPYNETSELAQGPRPSNSQSMPLTLSLDHGESFCNHLIRLHWVAMSHVYTSTHKFPGGKSLCFPPSTWEKWLTSNSNSTNAVKCWNKSHGISFPQSSIAVGSHYIHVSSDNYSQNSGQEFWKACHFDAYSNVHTSSRPEVSLLINPSLNSL